ncbi:MAG: DNA mismatch repair protein MutS [Candidatus Brocadiia bacterium]
MAKNGPTPMMRQYLAFKKQHEDALLLFRMGDFYELFYEDAKTAARVLGIALTSREKGEEPVPMAGFPCHSADNYIKRLIEDGHRVAVCDQVEDPSEASGLVDRDVTRVMTRGTLTEENILDREANNYLAAIREGRKKFGVAWLDLSTGGFEVEDVSKDSLGDSLRRIAPAECLLPATESEEEDPHPATRDLPEDCMVTRRPPWEFSQEDGRRRLNEHFGTASLDGFGCSELGPALGAAGAILNYVEETQGGTMQHITAISAFRPDDYLILDRMTQRSLELVETMRDTSRDGSLLSVLDETDTPPGARLLRRWILTPLKDRERIEDRLDAVEEMTGSSHLRQDLSDNLREIYDVERLTTKVSTGRVNARDLISLRNSLRQIPPLRELLEDRAAGQLQQLRQQLDPVPDVTGLIDSAIMDDPPSTLTEGGIIRDGFNGELDELRQTAREGKNWIAEFESKEAERTEIPSLKVGFNKVFGYYIEITNAHKDKVPDNYTRKQTLKNSERYITPELKDWESQVLTADDRAQELEYEIFQDVREEIAEYTTRLQNTARAIAGLDALLSLAKVSAARNYSRPEICEDASFEIEDGRHPVLEVIMEEQFVPNGVEMDGEDSRLMIVTGPNMAGKSVYIRQIALITLMAQMGCFVPAKEARVGVVDRIFTRVGASDVQARGQSTFMVEMVEVANILNNATPRSLIILDEVGRGTSTFDGVSIAWATAEHIHDEVRARTLFATHYHELAQLANTMEGVQNLNVAVREWQGEIIFLHRIVPGHADESYGIHVANLAGVPDDVVDRAREILEHLEKNAIGPDDKPTFAPEREDVPESKQVQMPLFRPMDAEIREELLELNPNEMTPIEALQTLTEVVDRLEEGE